MTGRDDELTDDWWHDEPYDADNVVDPPVWFPGQHLPEDARRLGLTQHVPEGALVDFAGSLDSTKTVHRVTAWFMLLVFGLPVVFAVMRLFYALS